MAPQLICCKPKVGGGEGVVVVEGEEDAEEKEVDVEGMEAGRSMGVGR